MESRHTRAQTHSDTVACHDCQGVFQGKVHAVRDDGTLSGGISYPKLVAARSCEEQRACIDDLVREGFSDLLPVMEYLGWPLESVRYVHGRLLQEGYLAEAERLARGYGL